MNSDQGSLSTTKDFNDGLCEHQIGISMDGRGRWRDNVFVERLWKAIKCERVHHRTARCHARPFAFRDQTDRANGTVRTKARCAPALPHRVRKERHRTT